MFSDKCYVSSARCGQNTMDTAGHVLYYSDMGSCMSTGLVLNCGGIHVCLPEYVWDSRATCREDWDLWVVLGGRGVLHAPGGPYELLSGACFILRPWEQYGLKCCGKKPPTIAWFRYDRVDARQQPVPPSADNPPLFDRYLTDLPFVTSLVHRALETDTSRADLWLQSILREIESTDTTAAVSQMTEQQQYINHLCTQIIEHPGAVYRIDALARSFHCTPDHFSRLFKRIRGMTPSEFIIRTRIAAAQRLLQTTSEPVKAVAAMLGYNDVYFFSRQFKARTGMTPSRCRTLSRLTCPRY